jgi:tellurite resistance protein
MGTRIDDLLSSFGRSVRRIVGVEEQSHCAAADRDASRPAIKVERTAEGEYRVGGFIFTTEAQARDFAIRRQKRMAPAAPAREPSGRSKSPSASSTASTPIHEPSPVSEAQRELMALYAIEQAPGGGFRAAGYVFTTLDQAVFWAVRRRGRSDPSPRLMSHAEIAKRAASNPLPASPAMTGLIQGLARVRKPEPARAAAVRWLARPETFNVGGLAVTAEMVYVGKGDPYDYQANNGLIDPSLKVAAQGDPQGSTLGYWPDYRRLDPRARRSYLEWLQGGRCGPNIPIGYVFLFFYGLEYRLLKDGAHDEAPAILAEVRRLHGIYGHHHSFHRYAAELIEIAELLAGEDDEDAVPSLEARTQWEMPLSLRVALGRKVEKGVPLNASDCLAWLLATPDTYLRTPAQRCFEELKELWRRRFDAAWPTGFNVTPPKARIKYSYRAAAANFTAAIALDQLPDVSSLGGPVKRFRELLDRCVEDIDAYSRFLGRNPEKKGSIGAAALLPVELQDGEAAAELRRCRHRLDQLAASELATTAADLLTLLDLEVPAGGGKVPATAARPMAAMLDLLDIGFEPDRRYGAVAPLVGESKLVLFSSAGGGKVNRDSPAYCAARTMGEIGALAATSDGKVVPAELDAIHEDILSFPELEEVERKRVMALATALLMDPPKRKETIRRLAALPERPRRQILRAAAAAILADGRILPAEVRFLEALHKALGLPQQGAYSLLHRGGAVDQGPVTVAPEERAAGTPLPAAAAASALINIDSGRLDRIRSETQQVSELLANIFVDEAEVAAAVAAPPAAGSRFERLDHAHAELLWSVVCEPLPPEQFEAYARKLNLLPDGAMETINEWGFETLDEAIMEDEEVIYVPEHLVDRLRTMGEAA